MYKNSNFRTLLALVLFFGIVLFGRTAFIYANTNSNTIEIEAAGSFYEDVPEAKGSILGAAQHFHIFSEKAVFHTHTNGNIATKELSGFSNAGTNKFGKEYFIFKIF